MSVLELALRPLAWAYGRAAALRRGAYRAGYLPAHAVAAPVISVGALAAGGSGKTPVAGWLAGSLLARGIRVGVVAGGYRGSAAGTVQQLAPGLRWEAGAAGRFGDEPLLLAGWHPTAVVVCGRDKLAGARLACQLGAEVIVVDDGFQHCRLARDLDLLLIDRAPSLPFPAGRSRELPGAGVDAHLRWEHRRSGELPTGSAPLGSSAIADGLHRLDGSRLGRADRLRGQSVFLLAGVARPEAFLLTVERLGARVVGQAWGRDHQPFTPRQYRAAARSRADLILCTEKDAVRLVGSPAAPAELLYLSSRVELLRGRRLLEERLGRLLPGAGQ